MATNEYNPEFLSIDTGGTMTDTFVVDERGNYTVGKAQSTPADESDGIIRSFGDALGYWGTDLEYGAENLEGVTYSGTAMINRLLEREGDDQIGLITTKGFEDTQRFGRARQNWIDRSYAGRLHQREHMNPEPIVDREYVEGVRGRIDMMGNEIVPIHEDEIREAVNNLIDAGVNPICVALLYSYQNQSHEERVEEITAEIIEERGVDTEIWLSSEQNPVRGELARMNTLLMEAYAVEPSRHQFSSIQEAFDERGGNAPVRILTASGGTISPDHDWLVNSMISGPIGGVFGGDYMADQLDIDNLVCSDVGGTSFDVALITEGHYQTRWDQALAQFLVNIPMTAMDTIGSGTGSFVRLDRATDRLKVGPESAGYQVGVSNKQSGLERPTVTDCSVILGYLNPDRFLGGNIDLDVDRAYDYIEDHLADPLGEDPYETARGVVDIVEHDMSNELESMVLGLGYSPENYSLMSYGGGGPLHVAGYTQRLDFQDVLIPEWAAAFSAFGCSATDAEYRYDKTLDLMIQDDLSNLDPVATELTEVLESLREEAEAAFERDDKDVQNMRFEPSVRIHYTGMLDNLEVQIPQEIWEGGISGEDLQRILDLYEEKFTDIFKRAAQAPDMGYTIEMAAGTGVAPTPKPTLPDEPLEGSTPPEDAYIDDRAIYWDGDWHDADILEMDEIQAGNVIEGGAVIEAPATTFLVPPGFETELDQNRIYHLRQVY
jgi:N-methylhydantoinase A/oxoprolinase/acetone carboxylase beta subunit